MMTGSSIYGVAVIDGSLYGIISTWYYKYLILFCARKQLSLRKRMVMR